MGRRLRLAAPPSVVPTAPVVVRSMSSPRGAWALVDAVRMAEQGYALHTAARRTGYAAQQIAAHRGPRRPRCAHVEHVEVGGALVGRRSYDLDAEWVECRRG